MSQTHDPDLSTPSPIHNLDFIARGTADLGELRFTLESLLLLLKSDIAALRSDGLFGEGLSGLIRSTAQPSRYMRP